MWRYDTLIPAAAPVVGEATSIYDSLLLGSRSYELSNHLGNVLSTISDKKIGNDSSGVVNYYLAEVLSQNDYYPFGMMMPGRKYAAESGYRYGFNGKENDNEVKGEGNQQDYGMRIYDPRVGRFLSVDPLTKSFPHYTPYQYAGCKPVAFIDLDGLEDRYYALELNITGEGEIKLIGFRELEELRAGKHTWGNNEWEVPDGDLGKGSLTYVYFSYNSSPQEVVTEKMFSIFVPKPKTVLEKIGDFLQGNGGGIRFYAEQGGNQETRECINCDEESEDISGLMDLFLNQKNISTDLIKAKAPKLLLTKFTLYLEKIKKYSKGAEGLLSRVEKIIKHLERINENKSPQIEPGKPKHKYQDIKPGTIVHPREFPAGSNIKVINDSTGQTSDKPAKDTINFNN